MGFAKGNPYAAQAEWGENRLIEHYWNESEQTVYNSYPYNEVREQNLNYWWKAHAVDAMMDGFDRTGDPRYTEKAEAIVRSIIKGNGSLFNEFYDDMEWLGLSALRLYQATGNESIKDAVLKLWDDIQTAWWEDDLGGMAWKKDQRDNRNTCSNAPGAILAARLYQQFGRAEDLEWALTIYQWQKKHLVDPDTGLVYDGLVLKQDGRIYVNKDWIFTYGQGTYIGAGVELYRITGDQDYLADAEKTAAAALHYHLNPDTGMMPAEGTGDGGLFKGILIRYLANLYEANPNEEIKDMIYHNADRLLETAKNGLFGTAWDEPHTEPLDVTAELSGVFLLEAAAKLARLDQA